MWEAQVCHFKGLKLHRTRFLNFLTQISALPVTACEFLSCKANQTFWSRLCLSLTMLELLKSAVSDSRLEGQKTCSSITVPRHVLGFALLMWCLSISAGRCCSGWEHCGVCPSLLQATASFNSPPNLIKLHLGSARGFVFLATPSGSLFQSFVFLAGNLLKLFIAS